MLEEQIKLETEYLSTMPLDVFKAKQSNVKKKDLLSLIKFAEFNKKTRSKNSKSGKSSRYTNSSRGSVRSKRDKTESDSLENGNS